MPCGYDLESCAAVHRAQKLGLRPTKTLPGRNGIPRPVQWDGGRCLTCGRAGKLSQAIKGGRIDYYCHACQDKTAAWQAQIRAEIAVILPDCIAPARKPKAVTFTPDDLAGLLDLSDAALRLRVACIAWQMTPKQAAHKLGMSRRTYYRAVTAVPDMARNRRSA